MISEIRSMIYLLSIHVFFFLVYILIAPSVLQNMQCGEIVTIESQTYTISAVTHRYQLRKGKYEPSEKRLDVLSTARYVLNIYLDNLLEQSQTSTLSQFHFHTLLKYYELIFGFLFISLANLLVCPCIENERNEKREGMCFCKDIQFKNDSHVKRSLLF